MSYQSRLDNFQNKLHTLNLDGMYITNLTNVRYLTGFTGSAGSLLVFDKEKHFFTDGRYIEQSKSQVKNCTIHIVGGSHFQEISKKNLIIQNASVGFESDYVSVNLYESLKNLMPSVKWQKTSGIIEKIAAVKDSLEIESLKTAIEITDDVFDKIIPELKAGAKEKDIAAKISYLFKTHGAEGDSYDPIIASGHLGALPHARPSDKEFEKHQDAILAQQREGKIILDMSRRS